MNKADLDAKLDYLLLGNRGETITAGNGLDPDIKITLIPLPMKKWRCTRGHKWESPVQVTGIEFQGYEDVGVPFDQFCMLCLYERCRDGLGRIREDV